MAINDVATRGYGTFGSIAFVATRGYIASAAVVVTPVAVTIAGKPRILRATAYYYKTLSELREEEKRRLAKLRKLAKAKIEAAAREGEHDETLLMALGIRTIEQAAPNARWLTAPVMDAVAARFLAGYIASILAEIARDEDDAEAILLLSA
ncbi:MAG: hypothetical protein NUW01_17575 [Gemmatimonadaceae bacterium]|nr:hypothetical protein [Gemmatimonadaceae bacterium]